MELQEIFDKSCAGIIAQGGPSWTGKNCRYYYETEDGRVLKCAAGQLVPEGGAKPTENYKMTHEPMFWARILGTKDDGIAPATNQFALLCFLQNAHDNAAYHKEDFFRHWLYNLENVIDRFHLDGSILETVPSNT